MNISQDIKELLFDHDCVIIPGFGGFVLNYAPAKIHPVQHLFNPPSKSILFNDKLKNNDGLLANQIAIRKKISYEKSVEIIGEFVSETLLTLDSGKRINMEGIGVLYSDYEGNIQFDQDTAINYLKNSFGLSSFISPVINRDLRRVFRKPARQFTDRKKPYSQKRKKQLTVWAIALIPVLIALTWVTVVNIDIFDNPAKNMSSLLPFVITTQPVEKKNDVINEEKIVTTDTKTEVVESHTENPVSEITKKEVRKVNENNFIPEAPIEKRLYHLIIGSFKNIENAEKLIDKYRDNVYEPVIIGSATGGYYRVSLIAYISKNEALQNLKMLKTQNSDIWIFRQ